MGDVLMIDRGRATPIDSRSNNSSLAIPQLYMDAVTGVLLFRIKSEATCKRCHDSAAGT